MAISASYSAYSAWKNREEEFFAEYAETFAETGEWIGYGNLNRDLRR